jgi:hypothetical protein
MSIAPVPLRRQEPPAGFYRLPVEVYHQMIAGGLLPEGAPYELIDGAVVRKDRSAAGEDPMTVGTGHATAVAKLVELNVKLRRLGCSMRVQQPVTLPPYNEPEPDGAIVKGTLDDYTERHPGWKDVVCVIEVADSSLNYDRTKKQQVYSDGGIPQYVLVNIPERCIEVYSEPLVGNGRYGRAVTLNGSQSLLLRMPDAKEVAVPIRRLLPR